MASVISADASRMPFGPELLPQGGVRFRLWAPAQPIVQLGLEPSGRTMPMRNVGDGWHQLECAEAGAGTLYRFVLPDGLAVPDPASRFQAQDVHGPSEVIDPSSFSWQDRGWRGRPWHEAVIYELHVGAFTEEGTFRAAIEKLDHLRDLGVTAVEIMPVADFPGRRNWGYDGVLPFAPDSSYGRPEDLKTLVDAAHERGIMVLLDVVYNHFGPDGNYLSLYAPHFFTERHKTPWGAAINFDGAGSKTVREFVVRNAIYWIDEYHMDGLRLDAVHAIIDDSKTHILDELATRVHAAAGGREIHLVLENEANEARRIVRGAQGRTPLYTAQWNDDLHHVLHVAATGERSGYYAEYKGDTGKLARALAEGFAYQGEMMSYGGHARGEASGHLPPEAFIAFIQNHDQIGNRAFGERIGALASPAAVKAIAAVYLLLPQIPMLFMGEEWGAPEPFPFFCDFDGGLAKAVREGRRAEFARFPQFQDPAMRERIPDPQAETTFTAAKLDWAKRRQSQHAEWLAWYRRMLDIRRREIMPLIPRIGGNAARHDIVGDGAVVVRWDAGDAGTLTLAANLKADAAHGFPASGGRILACEGEPSERRFGPWTVVWSIEMAERSR